MAYNTKPIVTDVDGNPISQYYNPETDQYEPVEGQAGANKVVLYNADGTENNNLSLIPILEKLSELTGTVIDEQTRQSNEQQRITFYNQLVEMLNTGQLKGDKGDTGETGQGLEFDWDGTRLGVRVEGDEEYIYVDLRGPQGPAGDIDNLTSQHIETALGYTPVKSVNNVLADEAGNVELDIDTSEIENRIGNVEDDLAAHKAENASQHGDLTTLKTSQKSSLVEAINELFTNVSDGKTLIATAITDKGIPASGSDTFSQLANKIEQIESEVEGYKVGDILNPSKYLIAPEVWQFTGHTNWVTAIAVDNNGNVYSGSRDNTVRKISPDGNQIWQFTGHTNPVNAVAVDNNGNIYSGSEDRTVRKISPDGNQIWQFTGHTGIVRAVAVDNNGNVYSGSEDRTVRKISPDGNQIWQFTGHTGWVTAIAVDNNGNVYSGSRDNTVRKISPDGNEIWRFTGHNNWVNAVAVDNDGNVYSGSHDNTVRKISPDRNEVWKFTGHTNFVYAVAVDNNGNVYSGSYDQTVRKISFSGDEIWQFTGHTSIVYAIAVDNNGNVYSGSGDRTVRKIFDGIKIIA